MEAALPSMLWQPESSWSRSDAAKVPRSLAPTKKGSLLPTINGVDLNKQPFRFGTKGNWCFRGGDWGLRTYTWRYSTMKKQPKQPFRLGTQGD